MTGRPSCHGAAHAQVVVSGDLTAQIERIHAGRDDLVSNVLQSLSRVESRLAEPPNVAAIHSPNSVASGSPTSLLKPAPTTGTTVRHVAGHGPPRRAATKRRPERGSDRENRDHSRDKYRRPS